MGFVTISCMFKFKLRSWRNFWHNFLMLLMYTFSFILLLDQSTRIDSIGRSYIADKLLFGYPIPDDWSSGVRLVQDYHEQLFRANNGYAIAHQWKQWLLNMIVCTSSCGLQVSWCSIKVDGSRFPEITITTNANYLSRPPNPSKLSTLSYVVPRPQ
jgi:hypothetical protein